MLNSDLTLIANTISQLVWVTNPAGDHVYYNQRWCDYTGMSLEESLGWNFSLALHPDDVERTKERWRHSLRTGEIYEIEYRFKRHDGMYRWQLGRAAPLKSEETGEIVLWFGTYIHDLKEAEENFRSVSNRLNMVLSAAQIGTWNRNLNTNLVEVDQRLLSLFDVQSKEHKVENSHLFDKIHPDDKITLEQELDVCVKEGRPYAVEYRINTSNGTRWLAGRGEVRCDANGQPDQFAGISWDITKQKNLEQERLQAIQNAQEQEQMRTKEAQEYLHRQEEFIDTVCHEVRNPLNGIVGSTALLQDQIQELTLLIRPCTHNHPNKHKIESSMQKLLDYTNNLENCAKQQKLIVDDVLNLSKLENQKVVLSPQFFRPDQLIREVCRLFSAQIESKELTLSIECSSHVQQYYKADQHRLLQILTNLISNAVKFTQQGGIKMTAWIEGIDDSMDVMLHFSCTDTGIGITTQDMPSLFNRFMQGNRHTSSEYGGSGLGLVISKKLVEMMGGRMIVQSKVDEGSCFSFNIRCQVPNKAEELQIRKETQQERTKKRTPSFGEVPTIRRNILIVEDNRINQIILNSYLEKSGCKCQLANNGSDAVAKYEQFQFDLIFMDIEMPVMNGYDATKLIREKERVTGRHTPIIGLSGNARREHADSALKVGMDMYLTKPFYKDDIYAVIQEYVPIHDT
ncbi:hybrid signal transduction histidine kinase dhkK [Acrasis kona]|uniref:histidine kinase n=1 Tax=Acrasis kona TaxID=1008807 RepID=A0AAW2ZJS1_9EUKA